MVAGNYTTRPVILSECRKSTDLQNESKDFRTE